MLIGYRLHKPSSVWKTIKKLAMFATLSTCSGLAGFEDPAHRVPSDTQGLLFLGWPGAVRQLVQEDSSI